MAESLAEAMEARGFGRSGRTFRHVYRMGLLDWLVILAGWAITFVMLRYFTR
jgi:energy-coupling factor transporter transmembrane protein EcfT